MPTIAHYADASYVHEKYHFHSKLRQRKSIAVIDVTKSRTGNYDFCACARARGFPGRTLFGRTHTLRRVCRAITR